MRKLFAAVAAATMLLAGCGGDSGGGNPKENLNEAVSNLSGGHTFTISLSSDSASLVALSEGQLNEDLANKVLDSSLSISSNGAGDPADAQFALAATIAGSNDVEVRYVDGDLYLRVDLDSLLDLAGPGTKATVQSQIDAAVQAASAQGLDFVEPAVNGEWIAFTGIGALLEQFGANATPDAEQQAIVNEFAAAVTKSATVTSEGDEDPGEHFVATANLKDLYNNFVDLANQLGADAAGSLPSDDSEVPNEDVKVDFWVDGGNLTQVEFDFLQIADIAGEEVPDGVDKLALRVQIDDFSGAVEVPSGATEVDFSQLMQLFSGGSESGSASIGGGDTSSSAAFCDALKDEPKSVQQQFADQCPNL
jgi:hypothetical protein